MADSTITPSLPITLADSGIKYLSGTINEESCKGVIEWIIEENLRGRFKTLTLVISSGGGTLWNAFALIDAMMGSKIPVNTVGLGVIASAGLLIFIHGKHRTITPNVYIIAHQFSTGVYGKEHELIAARDVQDWVGDKLVAMHAKCSKLSKTQVRKLLMGPTDTHLTAKQMLAYGMTDAVKLTTV